MFEAKKTNRIRDPEFLARYMSGKVLDIGCGRDLIIPHAQPFDLRHGDANYIAYYLPAESFDCVHSSHCLEHMHNPHVALAEWWSLVKPGGHMVVVVPEENLYEQGRWPSMFNSDHKWTFRKGGAASWSPLAWELEHLFGRIERRFGIPIDQTRLGAVAQIQLILYKRS
jgi:SAM-dependent methyltransferase